MQVRLKRGFHVKGDVETINAELLQLVKANGGEITAEDVLEAARKKRSALHGEFEWRDTEAARLYRLSQARYIMRAIEVIESEADEEGSRVMEVVSREAEEGETVNVYKTMEDILADPADRAELVERAFRELKAWARKYRILQELAGVVRKVGALADKGIK